MVANSQRIGIRSRTQVSPRLNVGCKIKLVIQRRQAGLRNRTSFQVEGSSSPHAIHRSFADLVAIRTLARFRASSYNPEEWRILRVASEALYGRQWQAPLSRDLGVTDRTVRNWAAGLDRPGDHAARILPHLRARAGILDHVIALAERLIDR